MLVPWRALNGTHRHRVQYKRVAEIKQRSLATEEEREVTVREFSTYGLSLEMVNSFQYLARVILTEDDDWTAVARSLSRARAVCKRMTRILSREGGGARLSGLFLKPGCRRCCSSEQRPGWSPPSWEISGGVP